MQENEVIIDRVNVAECDCYDNTYCLWTKKYHEIRITPKCEIVKNCYFKQLQRLKAENEELRFEKNLYKKTVRYMNELRYNETAEKYKTTLEEIRAYCMTDNIQKYTNDIFYYGKHSHNILKIINEVLTDD